MENKISVSIAGGSGYVGGELLRILLFHPNVELKQVTSERFKGKAIHKVHPNLRGISDLKFSSIPDLEECDCLFLCLPHGEVGARIKGFQKTAKKILDMSSDFRLKNPDDYNKWYNHDHECPELIKDFVYGLPELHREELKTANYAAVPGCNATTTILGLYPLFKNGVVEEDRTVVEVKVGSSEAGNSPNEGSHHPERSRAVRSFKPTGHRHTAEILQELSFGKDIQVHFSGTSIEMVRGILATSHVYLKEKLVTKDIWKLYRSTYKDEPFIRFVNEATGIHRYPDPKILAGTNYVDIGFELDKHSNRLVVLTAIDNLMKGAAGQAIQCFNLMHGFDETIALKFPGLHPA